MKRVAVNVSTGFTYRALQGRLNQKLQEFGNCEVKLWSEPLPKHWTPHSEVPYRFKAHALASVQGDLVLWLDSAILPLQSLEPVWRHLDEQMVFIPANPGMSNYDWTAISAYEDLFPDMPLEEATKLNRQIPHCSSAAFGCNLKSEIGKAVFDEFCRLAVRTNVFQGPWANANGPDCERYTAEHLRHLYTTAPCGPPEVRGHRHDQTVLSVIAWRFGIPLDTTLYAHEAGTPEPGEKVVLYHKI